MTQFELQRIDYLPSGIFGDLSNGMFIGEHSYNNLPKIPAGVGIWERYASPHFGYDVFRCRSVDGVDVYDHAFEIHPGNWPQKNSDGCCLIGTSIGNTSDGGKMLCRSDDAFKSFMASLDGQDQIQITIYDILPSAA